MSAESLSRRDARNSSMPEIDQSVAEILREVAESEGLSDEFQDGGKSRYKRFIDGLLTSIDASGYKRARSVINVTQIVIGAVGPPLGYLLRDRGVLTIYAVVAWLVWV